MATLNKAQFLADVLVLLKKRYKLDTAVQKFSVLEAVVYGICHEDATRAQADQALAKFKSGFFDWNEVRVSSISEIQDVLEDAKIPDAEERASKLRRFLRQLFEKIYGFSLEILTKKPMKESVKSLQEYEALASDFVLATVTRLALGGHAIGIDVPTRRALERLGVAEPDVDSSTLRGAIERAVPKNRGIEFVDLIEELSHDTCVAGIPNCPQCELRKICPYAVARKYETAVAVKAPTVPKSSTAAKPAGSSIKVVAPPANAHAKAAPVPVKTCTIKTATPAPPATSKDVPKIPVPVAKTSKDKKPGSSKA